MGSSFSIMLTETYRRNIVDLCFTFIHLLKSSGMFLSVIRINVESVFQSLQGNLTLDKKISFAFFLTL